MSLTGLSLNNATVACDKWMLVKGHDHCIRLYVRHGVELNTSSKYIRAGSSHIHHKGEIQAYSRKPELAVAPWHIQQIYLIQ